jgi:hypothetical protein
MNWRMVYALLFFLLLICGIISTQMAKSARSVATTESRNAAVHTAR